MTVTRRGAPSSMFCELADDRVREAKLLLSREHFTGAAHIAGYAAELLLKAVIAKQNGGYWPLERIVDVYRTHDLDRLLHLSGLAGQMRSAAGVNRELGLNWQSVRGWETSFRYRRLRRQIASDIVSGVTDEPDGVAAWLRLWV